MSTTDMTNYLCICIANWLKTRGFHLAIPTGRERSSSKAEDGISFEKFQQVLASLNITMPNMKRVFQLFDSNKDGTVDMRELICGLTSLREQPTTASALVCARPYPDAYFHTSSFFDTD